MASLQTNKIAFVTGTRAISRFHPASPAACRRASLRLYGADPSRSAVVSPIYLPAGSHHTRLARYQDEFDGLPSNAQFRSEGFGPGLPAVDALTLYMMVRDRKPKRYVEVGAGLSTYYCSLAARRNAMDGHPLEIVSIDPFPFERLRTMSEITLLEDEVQDVDISVFERLEADDILFIDSTHILKIDGDVPFLYLEVLPLLNVGVMVHVHDVPFPFNVPFPAEFWTLDRQWPVFWNEAMLLQAFLCLNERFRIELSLPLLRHFDEAFLRAQIRCYESVAENPDTFSSLWMRRVT